MHTYHSRNQQHQEGHERKNVKDQVLFFFLTSVRPKDKKNIFRAGNINEEPSFLVIRLVQIHRAIEAPSYYLRIQ